MKPEKNTTLGFGFLTLAADILICPTHFVNLTECDGGFFLWDTV